VIVDRVAPEHALFPEVAELGVGDGADGPAVVHRVAALALGVGGFDDDVAAEVRDLAGELALGDVLELQRLVERERDAVDRLDRALFRLAVVFHGADEAALLAVE
jgi:hypothetical protein